MAIKSKRDLQKVVMLDSGRWWNVNDLTEVLREKCKQHNMTSINHATVERNIRHFRETRYFLNVEKRKVSDNTYEFKVTSRGQFNTCSKSDYEKAKGG